MTSCAAVSSVIMDRVQAATQRPSKGCPRAQRACSRASLTRSSRRSFALVREASRRTLGMRHFDVQLMGGLVLHEGRIAEMRTGEGKTLAATLPVALNALTGRGSPCGHRQRLSRPSRCRVDGPDLRIPRALGRLHPEPDERCRAQGSLRCRRHLRHQQRVRLRLPARQHEVRSRKDHGPAGHNYAIVDEVDSILVDEARTPLIISGPSEESVDQVLQGRPHRPAAGTKGEEIEDKHGNKEATGDLPGRREGADRLAHRGRAWRGAEKLLGSRQSVRPLQHRAPARRQPGAARPHPVQRDVDYIVKDGEVIIVDEFTGRLMSGRRWSDGSAPGGGGQGRRSHPVARTRPWPRSPSRTTSACTTSSRA